MALPLRMALCAILLQGIAAFYLPGVSPVEYEMGDPLTIKVNSIKSVKTAIPYDYYSLMFCRPNTGGPIKADVENFGEILWGDVIKPARYQASMKMDVSCAKLCTTKPKDKDGKLRQIRKLKKRIDDEYRGHLILDNLPVSEVFIWEGRKQSLYYKLGYPLGIPGNKTRPSIVNNHLSFTIKYHKPEGVPGYRIVGFNVLPYSIASEHIDVSCKGDKPWRPDSFGPQTVIFEPKESATQAISWSYSIRWEEEFEVAWSSRWDHYLTSADASNAKIHWFSIVNSLLIVLFLSGMVAMILLRALHKDFNRYNDPDNEDEAQEETGWKLVHADVFRLPQNHELLCVYIGTGCQLLGMGLITLVFALAGFLSPANRGGLLTAMLLLFVLMGSYGGYTTARLAKMFHAQSWRTIFLTGVWFPGTVFSPFFIMNLTLWAQGASNAVPFTTLFALLGLWFCVSIPLVFVGAVFGYKRDAIEHPLAVNAIPRAVPEQKWYLRPPVTVILAGIIPFGAAFIELFFILSSLWLNKVYYVFGFLALVLVILAITCAEISIVMVYFQLCYEDYHWWWRSFFISGSSGLHLFLYSVFYFCTTLRINSFWSAFLYFGWMSVMSYTFMVLTGTIGFLATFVFVRKIYSALKVD
uniref:Transmembrane 9 superfamily member n=1 Tax=Eutreptiella gymnastica TaxID=73025 RepID=A0A7S1NLI2_9EUGL